MTAGPEECFWAIKDVLGVGKFGETLLLTNEYQKATLAIKVSPPKSRAAENSGENVLDLNALWKQDAEFQKGLTHPNIVKHFDTPAEVQTLLRTSDTLAMKYCNGGTLKDSLEKRFCGLDELEVLDVVRDITAAVSYLHGKNIAHLNICSNSILISRGTSLVFKLSDGGLSKGKEPKNISTRIPYIAPEFFDGEVLTYSADNWSLGVLFFEVLAGFRPFYRGNELRVKMMNFRQKNDETILLPTRNGNFVELKALPWIQSNLIDSAAFLELLRPMLSRSVSERSRESRVLQKLNDFTNSPKLHIYDLNRQKMLMIDQKSTLTPNSLFLDCRGREVSLVELQNGLHGAKRHGDHLLDAIMISGRIRRRKPAIPEVLKCFFGSQNQDLYRNYYFIIKNTFYNYVQNQVLHSSWLRAGIAAVMEHFKLSWTITEAFEVERRFQLIRDIREKVHGLCCKPRSDDFSEFILFRRYNIELETAIGHLFKMISSKSEQFPIKLHVSFGSPIEVV